MKMIWITLLGNSPKIGFIKIDSNFHSSDEIKNLVYKEFSIDFDKGIRLRNRYNSIVPINDSLDPNTKREPYYLEVYATQNKASKRLESTIPAEVLILFHLFFKIEK